MCRLLGIVASEATEFRVVLRDGPRSLAALSSEHPHGWGIAIHEEIGTGAGWKLHKGVSRASEDEHFHSLAVGTRGEMLIAHIRLGTVGPVSLDNTHPFHRGPWVFAHNGTIKDQDFLRDRTSAKRLAEIRGQTDSELFFAFLLTRLDEASEGTDGMDNALRSALREIRVRPDFGACNFVLANGNLLYAHRHGRTLFLLERLPSDSFRQDRTSEETGATVSTPWSRRCTAVFVASERLTDEPWQEIAPGMLMRIDALPTPRWQELEST